MPTDSESRVFAMLDEDGGWKDEEPKIGDTRPCLACGEPEVLLRPYDPETRQFILRWNCYNPDCPPETGRDRQAHD